METTLKVLSVVRTLCVLLLLPIATSVASVVITANEEPISRPAAAAFLIEYWDAAVRDPQTTWQMLAPEWRARLNQDAADPYQAYADFVSAFSRIEAAQIRETDRPNYFEVEITFTPKGNKSPVTEHLTYGLRCRWWDSHLPVFGCDPDELTIFDGYPTGRTTAP